MNERERLISAFYFSDLETIKQIVGDDPKGKLCSEDYIVGNFPSQYIPLRYITTFLKRIFSYDDFLGDYIPIAKEMRRRTNNVMDYLAEKEVLIKDFEVNYWYYWDLFYCEDPDSELKDILWGKPSKFIRDNCRLIDLKLFEAVCKFKFDDVKELLKEGANPEAKIYLECDVLDVDENGEKEYDFESCISRIEDEIQFLASCNVLPIYKEYFETNKLIKLEESNIHDLLGYAAHDAMWSLINKYWEREKRTNE